MVAGSSIEAVVAVVAYLAELRFRYGFCACNKLGMGHMATNPQVLYPELVRQFMATVQVYYAHERARRASEGILTFFIRGIRYRVPLSALSTICRVWSDLEESGDFGAF